MRETAADPQTFRWSRVATMAAVLLIHAGFIALLLLPAGAWRWLGVQRSSVRADALSLRFVAMPSMVAPPPRAKALPHGQVTTPIRRPRVTAAVATPEPQLRPQSDSSAATPLAPTDDGHGIEPAYVPGGGQFANPDFAHSNMHLPGSAQRVAGAPVLHMIDPKMQGIAGAVRTVQRLFGIPDSHCVDVDVWRSMTTSERIAKHIDDERIDETAARYHCGS